MYMILTMMCEQVNKPTLWNPELVLLCKAIPRIQGNNKKVLFLKKLKNLYIGWPKNKMCKDLKSYITLDRQSIIFGMFMLNALINIPCKFEVNMMDITQGML